MSRHYTILDSDVRDLGLFDDVADALDRLRASTGLAFDYAFSEEAADGLVRHVYDEAENRGVLTLVEDHLTPARYLITEAATLQKVERIASVLESELPTIPLSRLQAEAAALTEPRSLIKLALGCGEAPDPWSREIIRRGLESTDHDIRLAAVQAASLTLWPDFVAQVSRMSESDLDPQIREVAKRALSSGWNREATEQ